MTMRRFCLFLTSLCLLPFAADAQRDDPFPAVQAASGAGLPADSLAATGAESAVADLPPFSLAAPGFDGCAPWSVPYGGAWRLHEGLNAQFSLGVTAALGRHAPRGAGFSQGAAFVYAVPLTQRLSVAAGVYAAHMDWGAFRQTEAGVAALVAYRVNPAVSLYGYVSKSFFPRDGLRGGPFPLFLPSGGDRVGAMAEFKIGNHAAIQVGVECASEPGRAPGGFESPSPFADRAARFSSGLAR